VSNNIWVIGGYNGIGEAVAELAKHHPDFSMVHVTDLDVDATSREAIQVFLRTIGIEFRNIVYCPGVNKLEWIHELTTDSLTKTFDVNMFGFVNVLSALTERYTEGNVVSIVSDAAKNPMRGSMAYCASKAALAMAVRVAARELAPRWRINGVSPSIVDDTLMTKYIDKTVPGFRNWTPEFARDYELASSPLKRRCQKFEVAQLILDVLNGPAYMTGSIVDITGAK
jgi:NAD(P)-dependent dehydrogenase (short-subunit alcohol dehydrogenase family)